MPDELSWWRPSWLPRLSICPASGVTSEGQPNAASDATALGSAWHAVMEKWLCGGRPDIASLAAQWHVSSETLESWFEGLAWTPDRNFQLRVERYIAGRFGEHVLGGTPDLVILSDPPEVIDWKTGDPEYRDESVWWQLRAYGAAVGEELDADEVQLSVCYVQAGIDGWMDESMLVAPVRAQIAEILDRASAQRELDPEQRSYRTGDHCMFCPALTVCPARTRELRAFTAVEAIDPALVTLDNVGAILARAQQVERLAKAAKDAVGAFVRANGGDVELPEGGRLGLVQVRETIIPEHTRAAYEYVRRRK